MKTEEQFAGALLLSQGCVAAVASWMQRHKCDVMIRPTTIRPDFDSRNEFADCGDIEIRQRVEVKQRSIEFTCVNDYPYDTVIVDERFKVDRIEKARLWGYLIVSKSGTYVCCIKSDTKQHWEIKEKFDQKDSQRREFYVCPKSLCTFHKMT